MCMCDVYVYVYVYVCVYAIISGQCMCMSHGGRRDVCAMVFQNSVLSDGV